MWLIFVGYDYVAFANKNKHTYTIISYFTQHFKGVFCEYNGKDILQVKITAKSGLKSIFRVNLFGFVNIRLGGLCVVGFVLAAVKQLQQHRREN